MKRILSLSVVFFGIIWLQSCVESTTEATILKNGSGTVVTYVDMSKMFDIAKQMGKDPAEDKDADKVIDSVIYFKNNLKKIEERKGAPLTADEKEVYENTQMHMKMDMKKSIMNFTITSKFSKIAQLPITTELMKEALKDSPMSKHEDGGPGADKEIDKVMDNEKDGLSFTAKDGVIEYLYDSTKHVRSEEDEKMLQSFDMIKSMLGDMPIKVIYNLPRPSKKVTGKAKSEISADKKKVTITYDLLDVMKDPSLQSYKIEY